MTLQTSIHGDKKNFHKKNATIVFFTKWIKIMAIRHWKIWLQSNLPYVIFQGNSDVWSHKAGGCLIQV